MKKLVTLLAAAMLITMMGLGSAQAWTLGTTDSTTLTYDSSLGTFLMPATNYNFSLDPDPHMWDPTYTGPPYVYGGNHKFQSALNAFYLTINSASNITGYDRNGTAASVTPVNGLYWAITLDGNNNSPIRGYSSSGLSASVVEGVATVTGTLVSDGIFHWYGAYPDVPMASAPEYYFDKFNFVFTGTTTDNLNYTGTMTLYASAVPLPGTLALLGSGLAGLAFYRRRRANLKG